MKKKLLFCFMCLLVAAMCAFSVACGGKDSTPTNPNNQVGQGDPEEYTEGLLFTLNSSGEYSVSVGEAIHEKEIIVPGSYENKAVTTILPDAFKNCEAESIVLPDSITYIGLGAFSGCSNMTSITIPFVGASAHTAINDNQYPFEYIFGTEEFPDSEAITVGNIKGDLLDFESITTYYIPTSLETVIIDGCTSLPAWAFISCKNLTAITIPQSVTAIGTGAFYGCGNLTKVYYKGDLAAWCNIDFKGEFANPLYEQGGAIALYINDKLLENKVTVPQGVTEIKQFTFCNCKSLTEITIPSSVTTIGKSAFYNCESLTEITIPSSVTAIGSGAFFRATAGTGCKVNYLGDLAAWCNIDFGGETANPVNDTNAALYIKNELLKEAIIPQGVTEIKDYAFYGCQAINTVTIPEGVVSIGKQAFFRNDRLVEITIPISVQSIGEQAFYMCYALEYVWYGGTQSPWERIEGNNAVASSKVYYYNANPNYNGNYWRYVNGKPTAWSDNGNSGGSTGGGSGQTGSNYKTQWEADSLLRMVPYPSFGTCTGISGDGTNKGGIFTGVTSQNYSTYISLISSTFGYDVSRTDYSYAGFNSARTYRVSLGFVSEKFSFSILVTKMS